MKPSDALAYRRMLLEDSRSLADDNDDEWQLLATAMPVWMAMGDILETLPLADVYYVSADMTAVANAAAKTMPDQTLEAGDLPTDKGFMVYDAPIGWVDFQDGRTPINAITWSMTHHHEMPFWGDPFNEDFPGCTQVLHDEHNPEHKARWAREIADHAEAYDGDHEPPTGYITGTTVDIYPLTDLWHAGYGSHRLIPLAAMAWYLGSTPDQAADDPDAVAKTILATWTLMGQTITVTAPGSIERPERRRNARIELPAEVTVVRLRRRSTGHDDHEQEGGVEWSHRWLVGGHWRNQWLPSQNTHRLQWIAPHVKGPANLPLVVKERVTAWIR